VPGITKEIVNEDFKTRTGRRQDGRRDALTPEQVADEMAEEMRRRLEYATPEENSAGPG
jgi:hypothetical protein